jgi:hypothetical protein
MRRGRSTGTPTAAQVRRWDRIREKGCIACRMDGRGYVPTTVHHLTVGGRHGQRRRGHDATVGLCPWHHQGTCREGWSVADMTRAYGPSYAHQPQLFRDWYGEDEALLRFQEQMLML